MSIAPFTVPLPVPSCPLAWRPPPFPLPVAPRWEHDRATDAVDLGGVQRLLAAAGLPAAELLHMGCPRHWLASSAPPWLPVEYVVPLLGRAAWDAERGNAGAVWSCDDAKHAWALGKQIVQEWFR